MKRYHHQADIFKAIRAANNLKDKIKAEIESKETLRKQAISVENGDLAMMFELQIRALEAKVNRIENVRLIKLKNTLSAFQTEPLPFMNGDRTINLQ